MSTVFAKNKKLDGLTVTHMSAHSGFPGVTGTNELTGGGYSRQTCSFAAASGGTRSLSSAVNFTVGTGSTVRWLGLWDSTNFLWATPNAGIPKEFVVLTSTDTIVSPGHGFVDTNKIVFWDDTAPGGIVEGVIYFVRDATVDTFKVSATAGGVAIDLTAVAGSGCLLSGITEELYGGGGTHTVTAATVGLPN